MDVDKPTAPAGFFAPEAPAAEVDRLMGQSPVYVSSIAYGRTAVIAFESTYSENEVRAALNAKLGWNFGLTTAGGGFGVWHETALSNTRSERVTLFDLDCEQGREIAVEPGKPWQPDVKQVLAVLTKDGQTVDLSIRLVESKWNGLVEIENKVEKIRFEDGWQGVRDIKLTHEDRALTVVVELIPA